MIIPKIVFRRVVMMSVLMTVSFLGMAQTATATESVTIQKADFRGKNPWTGIKAAISASREDVVVVLVRGVETVYLGKVENTLKALSKAGYPRLGMIMADPIPNDKIPLITIVSNGTIYASIPEAPLTDNTLWEIYNLTRDAYKDNILSKISDDKKK